jgi:hypothetical protein
MTEQATIPRPVRRADYEPIVRGLRPCIGDEELMLRSSLLLMRDRAMATKGVPTTCAPSWALLDVVEQVTSECAMNHQLPVETLAELRRLCVQCVMTASSFDTLFQPRLPLEDGEANGACG